MNTNKTTTSPLERITMYTDAGKSTISMPLSVKDEYIAGFGSAKKFRAELNAAVRNAQRKPGFSRSMAVRLLLDEKLKATETYRTLSRVHDSVACLVDGDKAGLGYITGRNLVNAASSIAVSRGLPSSRSRLMNDTITRPFSTATPESAMRTTAAEIDTGMPRSQSAGTAVYQAAAAASAAFEKKFVEGHYKD